MIKLDELKAIASAKRLSVANAEKDYLLEPMLYALCSRFGGLLVLKGGTALYKFCNLNRFSEDLDFVLGKRKFDEQKAIHTVLTSLSLMGVEGRAREIERYKNEINIRLHFKGPLYNGSRESMAFISLNISLRERPLEIKKELFVPSYKEIPSFEVFLMGLQEILSEKVRAILTRNKARDVYDLWFLLKRGVRPDADLIRRKLKICKKSFIPEEFFKKVNEKQKFWETDVRGLMIGELPPFPEIRKQIHRLFFLG